jgi:Tfp pilus assembly protein PilX
MAGRILPVALATIVGVSIGVATFDGEFKKQRIARMEEEYKRELAAAAAASTANHTPAASNSIASPPSTQLQATKEEAVASAPADNSWSNKLGLWAWKKDNKLESATATSSVEHSKGKP